jgi:hypothetical protein
MIGFGLQKPPVSRNVLFDHPFFSHRRLHSKQQCSDFRNLISERLWVNECSPKWGCLHRLGKYRVACARRYKALWSHAWQRHVRQAG